jgi:hypothetical protein
VINEIGLLSRDLRKVVDRSMKDSGQMHESPAFPNKELFYIEIVLSLGEIERSGQFDGPSCAGGMLCLCEYVHMVRSSYDSAKTAWLPKIRHHPRYRYGTARAGNVHMKSGPYYAIVAEHTSIS